MGRVTQTDKGCPGDYVGTTSGVPQTADDLLQRPSRPSRATSGKSIRNHWRTQFTLVPGAPGMRRPSIGVVVNPAEGLAARFSWPAPHMSLTICVFCVQLAVCRTIC